MNFEIPVFKFSIKPILWLSQFFNENNFVLVCKGYDDDFELFTGIYWKDDKENCLDYGDYQVWINLNPKKLWP
jgi:hypothetical protein